MSIELFFVDDDRERKRRANFIYTIMSQRKRIQGQRRRLLKYIKSQTGTTDPEDLLRREKDIHTRIQNLQTQMKELEETIAEDAPTNDDDALREQQQMRLQYLHTIHKDMTDTLNINRRIYNALCL
jgi:two-component sensor histidine kinase